MSAVSTYIRRFGLFAVLIAPFFAPLFAPSFISGAHAADAVCTRICVQIIQAVGDDIKEQIPLDCVQESGTCSGTGFFTTADERAQVVITGSLSGDTLTLTVIGDKGAFAPPGRDALVITLESGNPYQATQFVVGQKSGDAPFANAGTSLIVTVIAERLI